MKTEDKPLYTCYILGHPSAEVPYLKEAALKQGINLEVEYHGCVVQTIFDDGKGICIDDADFKSAEYIEPNAIANEYYTKRHGNKWFKRIRELAMELFEASDDNNDLPF